MDVASVVRRALSPLGVLLTLLVLLSLVVTAGLVAALSVLTPRLIELLTGQLKPGWTMVALAVPALVCVQIVLVCTARLVRFVARDQIFSVDALPWVDAIVRSIVAGWVVLAVAGVPVFVIAELDDAPGLAALHLLALLGGAAVGLLMIVMRALLRQATTLRTVLEAVI